jgi:hypothetical protein
MSLRILFPTIIAAGALLTPAPAEAGNCFTKAAIGNGATEGIAKFEADTAILLFTNVSLYASYMGGNGTPGYSFGPRRYGCTSGLLGWECHASATLCKQ